LAAEAPPSWFPRTNPWGARGPCLSGYPDTDLKPVPAASSAGSLPEFSPVDIAAGVDDLAESRVFGFSLGLALRESPLSKLTKALGLIDRSGSDQSERVCGRGSMAARGR